MIAAIATLLAALGGLYFSTEQARQAQAGQTSERFSRSVEQLGSSTITVRIGAVYSFARLSRDSNDDRPAIGEILSSFVRLRAGARPVVVQKNQKYRPTPADLLAALSVLDGQPTQAVSLGLRERSMSLKGVDLSRFDLSNVAMRASDLTAANLEEANLEEANLTGANLLGANLNGARLDGANLTGANLTGARLDGANLEAANLTGAPLEEANLTGANLTGAELGPANLTRANLTEANLTEANLTGANLNGANLTGANLNGANLTGANLTTADLSNVRCSKLTQWPKGVPRRVPPEVCLLHGGGPHP